MFPKPYFAEAFFNESKNKKASTVDSEQLKLTD
jgi:hypothetical protein